jgi:hypothetical protein
MVNLSHSETIRYVFINQNHPDLPGFENLEGLSLFFKNQFPVPVIIPIIH